MFNLLGNLIFGYRQENELQENNNPNPSESVSLDTNASTSTSQSTQTCNENLNTLITTSVIAEAQPADWVIVDRSEEADRCNPNDNVQYKSDASTSTSMIQSKIETTTVTPQQPAKASSALAESSILGSFFERNQEEDEEFNRKYKSCKLDEEEAMNETSANKDWLITPLPCLTSITASQRSIENDPLENLLIEHPSMSVFVHATSSSSDNSFDEEMNVEENKPAAAAPAPLKPVEKNVVLVKSVSEKRKVQNGSPVAENQQPSPLASLRRKGKKNKKSAASPTQSPSVSNSSSASNLSTKAASNHQQQNKENVQQVLLAADFKKQANQARLESALFNKNQMKRSNKNSVFAASAKHMRKFHKLHQPAAFVSKPVF